MEKSVHILKDYLDLQLSGEYPSKLFSPLGPHLPFILTPNLPKSVLQHYIYGMIEAFHLFFGPRVLKYIYLTVQFSFDVPVISATVSWRRGTASNTRKDLRH